MVLNNNLQVYIFTTLLLYRTFICTSTVDKNDSVRYNVHINVMEVSLMLNINITNFRKNIFAVLEQTIKFNEPVNISTKDGNAVILSEEDYNGLIETLHLSNLPGMKEKITEGLQTPVSECIAEDKVQW